MISDESMNNHSEIRSALAAARHFLGDRGERADPRLSALQWAVRRGLIQYPSGRTPASCLADGNRLARALAEGDSATIKLLGVKASHPTRAASQDGAGGPNGGRDGSTPQREGAGPSGGFE